MRSQSGTLIHWGWWPYKVKRKPRALPTHLRSMERLSPGQDKIPLKQSNKNRHNKAAILLGSDHDSRSVRNERLLMKALSCEFCYTAQLIKTQEITRRDLENIAVIFSRVPGFIAMQ